MYVRVLVSTKRLLESAVNAQVLCADATHKLNWNGFPTILVGTIDKGRHFHPFGIALSSHERTEDFSWVFQELKKAIELAIDITFEPHILLADSADAITAAYENVFGADHYLRINCWAHVKRNVESKVKKLVKNSNNEKPGLRTAHL